MQGNSHTLSLKECYAILNVSKDATLDDVKHAYRVRAFELHPDLNPDDPSAGKNFQLLNEAYVALSAMMKARGEREGQSAKQTKKGDDKTYDKKQRAKAEKAYAEQDVLRDLLNDPFARRVFEDIYSELSKKETKKKKEETRQTNTQESRRSQKKPSPTVNPSPNSSVKKEKMREERKEQTNTTRIVPEKATIAPPEPTNSADKSVGSLVKGWLKRQIDDTLTLSVPKESLLPGNKLRLQIRHGLSNDVHTIEVIIPRDFVIGKPIRLKGQGKHLGPWQGDLYLHLKGV